MDNNMQPDISWTTDVIQMTWRKEGDSSAHVSVKQLIINVKAQI